MAKKSIVIFDELRCSACDRKLSKKRSLFETAWSGVYWCGKNKCAATIMFENCSGDEFDYNNRCNHEDDT